jgi:putative transposase
VGVAEDTKPTCHAHYARHRILAKVIGNVIGLPFRSPHSLRMVKDMLAARGVEGNLETVRQ